MKDLLSNRKESLSVVKDPNIIEFDKLVIRRINEHQKWNTNQLLGYDALIVDGGNMDYAAFFIQSVRAHQNPELYLKPIFVAEPNTKLDLLIPNLIDGEYKGEADLPLINNKVWDIFMRYTELEDVLSLSYEAQILKRLLNFYYTRNLSVIEPTQTISSIIGYAYPLLTQILKGEDEPKVIDILAWGEAQGLMTGEFLDRVYLCNLCSGGFLSYREVCPNCHSADASTQDLVHHFPCAFVGPLEDFKVDNGNTLDCPKCNKKLRHIGLDYDKPSVVHRCNRCKSEFQDLCVKAKCISCTNDTEVQYLVPAAIKKYQLTKKGRMAAITSILSAEPKREQERGNLSYDTFKLIFQHEIDKNKYFTECSLYLLTFSLDNLTELTQRFGRNSQYNLYDEVIQAVKNLCGPIDIICMDNDNSIYILLLNYSHQEAKAKEQSMKNALKKLFADNFNHFELAILHSLIPIAPAGKAAEYLKNNPLR